MIIPEHSEAENDMCQAVQTHPGKIEHTAARMAQDTEFRELAEIFKMLSDFNRLRILHALKVEELCVCDLSQLLGLSPSGVSHQLRLLRTARLVRFRKEGKNVYYSLDDSHVKTLLDVALLHVQGSLCKKEA